MWNDKIKVLYSDRRKGNTLFIPRNEKLMRRQINETPVEVREQSNWKIPRIKNLQMTNLGYSTYCRKTFFFPFLTVIKRTRKREKGRDCRFVRPPRRGMKEGKERQRVGWFPLWTIMELWQGLRRLAEWSCDWQSGKWVNSSGNVDGNVETSRVAYIVALYI